MLILIRRFSHRHSRSFFIPNYKQIDNPLNECEKPFVPRLYKKKFENPLNECEKTFVPRLYKKNCKNSLNECEKCR